jgi:hypothetical protein
VVLAEARGGRNDSTSSGSRNPLMAVQTHILVSDRSSSNTRWRQLWTAGEYGRCGEEPYASHLDSDLAAKGLHCCEGLTRHASDRVSLLICCGWRCGRRG